MRVLVDTSVWIDFFNDHTCAATETLARLIEDEIELLTCGVIVSEFLQGIRDLKTLAALETQFRDMDWLTPVEPDTYVEAANLFRQLRAKGVTIRSTIDCLIAQLASDNDTFLLSKDRDMAMILQSGITRAKPLRIE
jgi:predicted nucleic acid-binding protein